MTNRTASALLASLLLTHSLPGATVLNDGSTADGLTQLSVVGETGATMSLEPIEGVLAASQSGTVDGNVPLRTVWFANAATATNAAYQVAADFQPAAADPRFRGGVMGWLVPGTGKGIALLVKPVADDEPSYFAVAVVDFNSTDPETSETATNLFNLDGSPATFDFTSARSEATNYNAAAPATFRLEFVPPTNGPAGATGRLTGRVSQGGQEIARPIELFTDLPGPGAVTQRVGYYAYFSSIFNAGRAIGDLDNLTVDGGVAVVEQPVNPPSLAIALTGDQIEVTWPLEFVGYRLQVTAALGSGWTEFGATPGNRATIPAAAAPQFFRLIK